MDPMPTDFLDLCQNPERQRRDQRANSFWSGRPLPGSVA